MSLIRLRNIQVEGCHGVYPEEKTTPRIFTVNVEVEAADMDRAVASDALDDAVDYVAIARAVKDVIEGPSRNLLEALAGEILDRIGGLAGVRRATVRVSKPAPPGMGVTVESAEVELTRSFS